MIKPAISAPVSFQAQMKCKAEGGSVEKLLKPAGNAEMLRRFDMSLGEVERAANYFPVKDDIIQLTLTDLGKKGTPPAIQISHIPVDKDLGYKGEPRKVGTFDFTTFVRDTDKVIDVVKDALRESFNAKSDFIRQIGEREARVREIRNKYF